MSGKCLVREMWSQSIAVNGVSENAILKSNNARFLDLPPYSHAADDI